MISVSIQKQLDYRCAVDTPESDCSGLELVAPGEDIVISETKDSPESIHPFVLSSLPGEGIVTWKTKGSPESMKSLALSPFSSRVR